MQRRALDFSKREEFSLSLSLSGFIVLKLLAVKLNYNESLFKTWTPSSKFWIQVSIDGVTISEAGSVPNSNTRGPYFD